MIKNQKKLLIAAGAVLVLLAAVLIFLLVQGGSGSAPKSPAQGSGTSAASQPEAGDKVVARLLNLTDADEIAAFIAAGSGRVYAVTGSEGAYEVQGYESEDVDQKKIAQYIADIKALTTVDMAVNGGVLDNMGEYGFDDPATMIELRTADGRQTTLLIGNKHPVDENWYVMTSDYDAAFFISDEDAQKLIVGPSTIVNTSFYEELTDANVKNLTDIEISGAAREDTLKFHLIDFIDSVSIAYYRMTEPVTLDIDKDEMKSSVTAHLQELSGYEVAGTADQADAFGLGEPDYTLALRYMGEDVRISFKKADDGDYYALRDGAKSVMKVAADKLGFLSTGYRDVIGDTVYYKNITTVSHVDYTANGRTYSIDISGEGGGLLGVMDGHEIDSRDIVSFYMKLCNITIEGETEPPADMTPEVKAVISFRDGTPADTIELIPISDRQCAIAINGEVDFYTYRKTVDLIWNEFQASVLDRMQ